MRIALVIAAVLFWFAGLALAQEGEEKKGCTECCKGNWQKKAEGCWAANADLERKLAAKTAKADELRAQLDRATGALAAAGSQQGADPKELARSQEEARHLRERLGDALAEKARLEGQLAEMQKTTPKKDEGEAGAGAGGGDDTIGIGHLYAHLRALAYMTSKTGQCRSSPWSPPLWSDFAVGYNADFAEWFNAIFAAHIGMAQPPGGEAKFDTMWGLTAAARFSGSVFFLEIETGIMVASTKDDTTAIWPIGGTVGLQRKDKQFFVAWNVQAGSQAPHGKIAWPLWMGPAVGGNFDLF